MIIGKINDDVYIDDAVLWKTKPKIVINNQEITDLETFNKVVDSIKEKNKDKIIKAAIRKLKAAAKHYALEGKNNAINHTLNILKEGK